METTENTTQNVLAENTESAPVQADVVDSTIAVNEESAPSVAPAEQNTAEEGSEPSKAVKELIAQRKRRQEAEKEAAYWRGRAESGVVPEKPKEQAPSAPVELKPPNLDNFETYEEYERAKDEYLVEQAERRVIQKFQHHQQQLTQQEQAKQAEKVAQGFWKNVDKIEESDPYIRSTIQKVGANVSPVVADLVVSSEVGLDLVRYFDKNPAEAIRISSLPPVMAAREFGLVEAKIKFAPKPEPPKRVSQAPEPIPTIAPVGSVSEFDPETAPMDEYYKRRTAQLFPNRR